LADIVSNPGLSVTCIDEKDTDEYTRNTYNGGEKRREEEGRENLVIKTRLESTTEAASLAGIVAVLQSQSRFPRKSNIGITIITDKDLKIKTVRGRI
jgi:hypothetical protein